jgi:hypothetical protein
VPELDSLDEADVDVALEDVDDDAAPDEGDEVPDDEVDPLGVLATLSIQLCTHAT